MLTSVVIIFYIIFFFFFLRLRPPLKACLNILRHLQVHVKRTEMYFFNLGRKELFVLISKVSKLKTSYFGSTFNCSTKAHVPTIWLNTKQAKLFIRKYVRYFRWFVQRWNS